MMVTNIEGLAGFTKRNRRSCEIFYARRKNTLGPRFYLSRGVQALLTLLIHQIKVLFRDTPRKRGGEGNGLMVKFCKGK